MQEAGQGARKHEATLQPGELGQITDQIADGAMEQAVARLSLGRPLRGALEPGCVGRSPTAGASNSPQVGMNSIMKVQVSSMLVSKVLMIPPTMIGHDDHHSTADGNDDRARDPVDGSLRHVSSCPHRIIFDGRRSIIWYRASCIHHPSSDGAWT